MKTIMFQHRFAPMVRDGRKRQTIRPKRKRPIKPGDMLSLRQWEGKAYRSKQVELCKAVCKRINPITIEDGGAIVLSWLKPLVEMQKHAFAQADGFADFDEMYAWFAATHGLPFHGDIIEWEPTP